MREENDKKGGGLMALSRKGKFQSIGMKQFIDNDLLEIYCMWDKNYDTSVVHGCSGPREKWIDTR